MSKDDVPILEWLDKRGAAAHVKCDARIRALEAALRTALVIAQDWADLEVPGDADRIRELTAVLEGGKP